MNLFHSLVDVFRHTKRAEETQSLKKYRNDLGQPFGFTSAIPPVLPVAASNCRKPQVSIREERKPSSHVLADYFMACIGTVPSRTREDQRKTEQTRKIEQAAIIATEHARLAEQAERAQWAEKARQEEVKRKMEEAKQAELARRATEKARRQAGEALRLEGARRAEEERKAVEADRVWLQLCEEFRNGSPRASDSEWETEEELEDDGAWGGLGDIIWWDWDTGVDDGYGTDPENLFNFDDYAFTADDADDDGFFDC